MATLIVIIYLSFISLGLPDSLLGAVWPILHTSMNVPTSYAGILSATSFIFTVIASLSAMYLNKTLGTGKTIAFSTILTSIALFGYSIAPSFWMLIPISIVLGLGGGAIDSALNNYVALHYKSSHMSFLHAFWGLGATIGPMILTLGLSTGNYQKGYRIIATIQMCLAILQLFYIKHFDKTESKKDKTKGEQEIFKGTSRDWTKYLAMLSFFFYCSIETTLFIWIATYFVNALGANEIMGAQATSAAFIGLTFGRFISGFISEKLGVIKMIYLSVVISLIGSIGFLVFENIYLVLASIIVLGLGFASFYPSMIHRTPRRFGSFNSPKIIGQQMASAYIGSSLAPAAVGFLLVHVGYKTMPIMMVIGIIMILILTIIIEIPKEKTI